MKNIVLADCEEEEVISLCDELCYSNAKFVIKSHIANWSRNGALSELKRYAKYFLVALKYFLTRKNYNMIIGWQQFYALIFCFYCSVFKVKKVNKVIALNFTYKQKHGKFSNLYKWFMEKCLSGNYIDYIHVPSKEYADKICEDFNFSSEKIIVTPFGVNEMDYIGLPVPEGVEKNGYALAIGRSNRDYDFLCRAWKRIDYPLIIISDTYKCDFHLSDRVKIFSDVSEKESYKWIAHCNFMIIPIKDSGICSGDTVLLRAMSFGCRILVTFPSTLAEMYVKDGKNALLFQKNESELKSKVDSLLNTTEFASLGENAKKSFSDNFSRKSMGEKINSIINDL